MIRKITLTFLISLCVLTASAISFRPDSYDIYVGDVDGDGTEDLYLAARDKLLFLGVEVVTPITYQDGPSYLLVGNSDGSYQEAKVWNEDVDVSNLTLGEFEVHIADMDGNGVDDLLLQSAHVIRDSVVLYGNLDRSIIGSTSFNQINGEYVSLDYGAEWTLQDVNGDGQVDIILNKGTAQQTVGVSKGLAGFYLEEYGTPSYQNANAEIVVGATAGEVNVSQFSGGVSYSIPIAVPTGPGNVSPQFAISYSNMGGDGPLGKGFSLSGLNEITRCSTSLAIEGYIHSIFQDSDYAFCLDGKRLIQLDGGDREYRLQIDSIARIKSVGGTAQNPQSFEIHYKSGEKEVFGGTGHGATIASESYTVGRSRWRVIRREDAVGNGYDLYYSEMEDDEESLVDYVKYRNRSYSGSDTPEIRIDFEYSERSSAAIKTQYHMGRETLIKHVLKEVKSTVNGEDYRRYNLTYDSAPISNLMRLKSVQECGADGTCFKPTTFKWNDHVNGGFNALASIDTNICRDNERNSTHGNCDKPHYYNTFQYPDINGDGYQDICYRSTKGIVCFVSQDGVFDESNYFVSNICGYKDGDEGCNDSDNHDTIRFIDFNGDGKDDLIFRADDGLRVFASDGSKFESYLEFDQVCPGGSDCLTRRDNKSTLIFTPDLNGDARPELCWVNDALQLKCVFSDMTEDTPEAYSEPVVLKGLSNFDRTVIQFPDIDGDGDQDILLKSTSDSNGLKKGLVVYSVNYRDEPELDLLWDTGLCSGEKDDDYDCDSNLGFDVVVGNINGDSYDDVCYRTPKGMSCLISRGDGYKIRRAFAEYTTEYGWWGYCGDMGGSPTHGSECKGKNAHAISLMDFNGDGMDDLIYRGYAGVNVILSNSHRFQDGTFYSLAVCGDDGKDSDCKSNDNSFGTLSLLDYNNDGNLDIAYRSTTGLKIHLNKASKPRYLADTVSEFVNGHGLKQVVEYSNLLDPDIYLTDAGSRSFVLNQMTFGRISKPVVKKLTTISSNSRESYTSYQYESFTQLLDGHGGAGFKTVTALKEYGEGKAFKTVFNYLVHFPYVGSVWSTNEYYRENNGDWIRDHESYTSWHRKRWDNVKGDIYRVISRMTRSSKYHTGRSIKTIITKNYFDGDYRNGSLSTVHSSDMFGDITRQVVKTYATRAAWTGNHSSDNDVYMGGGEFLYPYSQVETVSEYYPPNENSWILGRLKKTTVSKQSFDNKTTQRSSEWTYYGNGLLKSETFAPDTEFQKITSYTYNTLGQQTSVKVTPISGLESETKYTYQGGYLYSSTNPLGFTSYIIRHDVLGVPETAIDINGFISVHEYDGFARKTRSILPTGGISETRLSAYPRDFSGTTYVETVTDNMGGFYRTYYDNSGFEVGSAAKGSDGRIRYQKKDYNDIGMAVKSYLPSLSKTSFEHHSGISEIDHKLRVVRSYDSRGYETRQEYYPFRRIVTNPKLQKQTEYIRPDGKTIKVIQSNSENSETYEVSYDYDVDGNLISSESEGSTIINEYDAIGRRIRVIDPDKGSWEYTYNALDQIVLQKDGKQVKTCFFYDLLGRKVKTISNYQGSKASALNSCSAGGLSENIAVWEYDQGELGSHGQKYKAALSRVVNGDGYTESYFFDNYGRTVRVDRKVKGSTYTELTDYDQYSRIYSHTYPSSLRIRNIYNSAGSLTEVKNFSNGFSYWKVAGFDDFGRVNKTRLGNGLYEHSVFAETHSAIDRQVVSTSSILPQSYSADTSLLWLDYRYDALDNYTHRNDLSLGLYESFEFDHLNRMKKSELKHGGKLIRSETMEYFRNGNIEFKPGVGVYSYGKSCNIQGVSGASQAGPHAVSSVSLNNKVTNYCYDSNGNLIADSKRRLYYGVGYDKPVRITHTNGSEVEFSYDQNLGRYYRKDSENGSITETFYAASGYEKVVKNVGELNEQVLDKHYIGGSVVEIYINGNQNVPDRRYLHKDNLGSVVMITDASKKIIERHNFDPWGEKRNLKGLKIPEYLELESSLKSSENPYITYEKDINGDGYKDLYLQAQPDWILIASHPDFIIPQFEQAWLYLGKADGTYHEAVAWFDNLDVSEMVLVEDAPIRNDTTQMGFTGHEQLDSVGLVHMGGRLYDPVLGRMLSADPFVQAPGNSQSFNRYSYVMNNPISMIDPSGYLWNPIKSVTKGISRLGSYLGSRAAQFDDWQRTHTDQFGQWFREKAAQNPRMFALLQAAGCATTGGLGCAVIQGISTGIITKDFKAGLRSAAVAVAYSTTASIIGGGIGNPYMKVGAHGLLGGAHSRLNGGSFWRGAISTMAAEGAAEFAPEGWNEFRGDSRVIHALEGALIGGTSAVITGGGTAAFANGAASGAMSRLFNHCDHESSCAATNKPKSAEVFHEAFSLLVPGYDLYNCYSTGNCSTTEWMMAAAGVVPANKGAIALAKVGKGTIKKLFSDCCFVAGTRVLTRAGYKNIEKVKQGDLVLSKNVDNGDVAYKPVTQLFKHHRLIYELRLEDPVGNILRLETTDDHPFYVPGTGFIDTIDLYPGLTIETKDGANVTVTSVLKTDRYQTTYNLEVADFHTYYVTEHNVLVHNCDIAKGAEKGTFPDEVFSSKAPKQTTPGAKTLEGQHINNKGRVEPWTAHYDKHGRQIGRTDYNAGNKTQGIPSTHHHTKEYNARYPLGRSTGDHIPGEYKP